MMDLSDHSLNTMKRIEREKKMAYKATLRRTNMNLVDKAAKGEMEIHSAFECLIQVWNSLSPKSGETFY